MTNDNDGEDKVLAFKKRFSKEKENNTEASISLKGDKICVEVKNSPLLLTPRAAFEMALVMLSAARVLLFIKPRI